MTRQDPEAIRESVQRRLVVEGLPAALDGALRVLNDPKAQASAVATAAMMIFRSTGMIDKAADPAGGKELHEMTWAELSRERERLEAEWEASRIGDDEGTPASAFD